MQKILYINPAIIKSELIGSIRFESVHASNTNELKIIAVYVVYLNQL
jgi:hypothetical protein